MNDDLAGASPVDRRVRPLREVLTDQEARFVKWVYRNPGGKCNDENVAQRWEDDGTEFGAIFSHWEKPEALGLVECVGSWKWKPTAKLVLAA